MRLDNIDKQYHGWKVKMCIVVVFILLLLSIPAINANPVKRGPNWIDTAQPDGTHVVEIYTRTCKLLEQWKLCTH